MGVCEDERFHESPLIEYKANIESPAVLSNKPVFSAEKDKAVVGYCTHDVICFSIIKKRKDQRLILLIAALILVIIGLSAALITVIRVRTSSNETGIWNLECAPCEDDWIRLQGKCYYFSTEPDTWNNSEKFCHSHNSSLAIIENKQELDFLIRYKGKDNHWIGIRRTDDDTAWTWTNGTLYHESLFRITRQSEHSGEIEYVFLNHNGVRSQEGIYEYKWICSRT